MDRRDPTIARAPEPPHLPKHVKPSESLGGPLEDGSEFAGLLVVNGDLNEANAHRATLNQMQFRHCRWQQAKVTAGTLRDVRFTVCDLSQGEWDETFIWRGEIVESRLLGWRAA